MLNRRIKSNFIFNALYQLSGIVIPIITIPYLTRTICADGMGVYSYAYNVAFFFYMFIRLGLHNYGNRTIAYVKDDKYSLSKTFFEIYASQVVLCIFFSGAYIVYSFTIAPDRKMALIFLLMVLAGGIDLTWALYGLEEFKVTSIRDVSIKILTAVCIFIFIKDTSDTWKYALIYCVGFLFSQLISLPVVFRRMRFTIPDFSGVKSHVKPNLILFLPTIAVSIYRTMDKIMLGAMANDAELGYYHVCDNIILVPLALITALGTVMLPRMSNMISQNGFDEKSHKLFDYSITFTMFFSTSICMGIMTVAKEFVLVFFGRGYEKCIILFFIILPSCIFMAFANVIRTQYLLPQKMDKQYIVSLFTGAGVNLTLNIILIPHMASVGAAIGTLTAEIVVCIIQAAYVFEEARIGKNIINAIPYVISGIMMFFALYNYVVPVENTIVALLLKIVMGGVLYLFVLGVLLGIKRIILNRI